MSSTARPTTWLVTGASRGIGLELVKQLLETPTNLVVAAARTPSKATALHDLQKTAKGTLHVVQLDVGDFASVRALPPQLEPTLGATGLDYLINNAGIALADTAFTVEPEALLDTLRTNAVGPAHLSRVLLPYLEKAPTRKILNVSSTAGSIASAGDIPELRGHYSAYAMSKAALNMLTVKQKLERPDIIALTLCPGWVKTDMGGERAAIEPSESVAGILKVITSATKEDSGKYLRQTGEVIPW